MKILAAFYKWMRINFLTSNSNSFQLAFHFQEFTSNSFQSKLDLQEFTSNSFQLTFHFSNEPQKSSPISTF